MKIYRAAWYNPKEKYIIISRLATGDCYLIASRPDLQGVKDCWPIVEGKETIVIERNTNNLIHEIDGFRLSLAYFGNPERFLNAIMR
jgi:hypothetical protein